MEYTLKVQTTTDPSVFKFMDENRVPDKAHIEYLAKVINKSGNITEIDPIVVNERMEVINGQHRVRAFQLIAEDGGSIHPIHYMTRKGLRAEHARLLNSGQKKWTPIDYARSFCKAGNANYCVYAKFHDKFEDEYALNSQILREFLSDRGACSVPSFNSGNFVAGSSKERAHWFDQLIQIGPHYRDWEHRSFALACLKFFKQAKYNHEHMLVQLSKQDSILITIPLKTKAMAAALQGIYNTGLPTEQQIVFGNRT